MWLASRLLVVAVLLAVLLYFLPTLIISTGAWRKVLAAAAPGIAGQIQIQSLRLGWFSPIEIQGLVVRDESGAPLAEAPLVRSNKTLLAIALDHNNLGTFELQQPKANIVVRADGSNVEDFLAKLPKSAGPSMTSVGVIIHQGTAELHDQVTNQAWQVNNFSADIVLPAGQGQKSGKLAGAVQPAAGSGQFAVEFTWQPGGDKAPAGTGQAKLALVGVPTELAAGALRRAGLDIRPQGPLTTQVAADWNQPAQSAHIVIQQLTTPGLSIAAPKVLGRDQPTIAITSGQADVQAAAGQLAIRSLDLRSNLVTIAGNAAAAANNVANSGNIDIRGQLNVAALAQQLPDTLHLKQDTQVTAGTIDFTLASSAASAGRDWRAALRTADIRGVAAGRPIEFNQPLEVQVDVRQTPAGFAIERMIGQASFLKLEGQGTLAQGNIQAHADLNRLVAELSRLVDWGQTRLAGTLDANLRWQHQPTDGWTGNGNVELQNFELQAPGLAPWREPSLRLTANVHGNLGERSLEDIDRGQLTLTAGTDQLQAELTDPVKAPSLASLWPLKFTMRGDLASWAPRLQPIVPLGDWRLAGALQANGSVRASPSQATLGPTTIAIYQFALDGPTLAIHEPGTAEVPGVKIDTSGAWNAADRTLTLGSTLFATSSVAFRADDVHIVMGATPSLTGRIDFRGDLGRMSNWLAAGGQPPTTQVAGMVEGRAEIGYRGQALAANWKAAVDNLTYRVASAPPQSAWRSIWQEPRVDFAGQGTYEPSAGTLQIDQTSVVASSGSVSASGTVSQLPGAPQIDLTGEVSYDLALVTQQIQSHAQKQAPPGAEALPYGLATLQLAGKEKRPFSLRGPLLAATGNVSPTPGSAAIVAAPPGFHIPPSLAGEASLGWQGAQYVGLVAGPADLKVALAGGAVQVGPLDIPLAEGRLKTQARVLLDNPTPQVVVERGPLLENVRISPEMCRLWLKFVAPLVADATSAEGKFSLSLEGASVPLAAPKAGNLAGTLAIESAQLGPGPLAEQYLGVLRQLRSFFDGAGAAAADGQSRGWVILPKQDVAFEVHDGVAVNRGLKMSVGDLVITTEGTVEIETQKINLVASIPLHESWFKGRDGLLGSLKGQTLQIPIDGTLTQPRLNTRVLQDLGRQLAGSAIQGAITNQLQRGQGAISEELQKGQGLLQRELSQGLGRLLSPLAPQPQSPATPTPPPPR
jgi:hypothetical protein